MKDMVVDPLELVEILALEIIKRNFVLPNQKVPGEGVPLGY